jgi:hypothetical protein
MQRRVLDAMREPASPAVNEPAVIGRLLGISAETAEHVMKNLESMGLCAAVSAPYSSGYMLTLRGADQGS